MGRDRTDGGWCVVVVDSSYLLTKHQRRKKKRKRKRRNPPNRPSQKLGHLALPPYPDQVPRLHLD
jgi:hypothetical protein